MNNTPDNIRNMWEQAAEISESKYGKKGVKPKTVPGSPASISSNTWSRSQLSSASLISRGSSSPRWVAIHAVMCSALMSSATQWSSAS